MAERIALFGGSFNPVHSGHLIIARRISERLSLDRVVFLPSAAPPHKQAHTLVGAEHRARMVELAIEGEAVFELSDFDLVRAGLSYTIDTVHHFRSLYGAGTELYWIIGADSLSDLSTWHRVSELIDACGIITAGRAGWERIDWGPLRGILTDTQIARLAEGLLDTPVIEISSTDIRDRRRAGRSIRYLVPDAVAVYIDRHRLYRDSFG